MEDFKGKIHNEQIDIIKKGISEEVQSMHVVNICFKPFESSNDSQFVFHRTDPLFLSGVVNFDIMLSSSYYKTACLIECKSSLNKSLIKRVNEFQEKIDFVEKNNWVDVGGRHMRIKDYFVETLGIENPNFYYVLASEIVDYGSPFDRRISSEEVIEVSRYPFDIWHCYRVHNNNEMKITRNPVPSRDRKDRHISIDGLSAYLGRIHSSSGDDIQICLSSSNFYLAVQCCINLHIYEHFGFDNFLFCFRVDLKEYEEFEKKNLFERFIVLGRECRFLKVVEDTGDVFTSSYAVINRRLKADRIQENVIEKMARRKVESSPELRQRIEEEEKNIIEEIFYKREPRQRKLTEF